MLSDCQNKTGFPQLRNIYSTSETPLDPLVIVTFDKFVAYGELLPLEKRLKPCKAENFDLSDDNKVNDVNIFFEK